MQDSKYFLQSKQAVNVFFQPIKIDRVVILLVFFHSFNHFHKRAS